MINVDTPILTARDTQLTSIPIGASLQFSVSYHDDIGMAFFATNVELAIRCSRLVTGSRYITIKS